MKWKAVIWDLGNVLVDWNPEYVFRKLIPEEEKRKYFFENICTSDWNENQDEGYPIKKATEELVAQHPDWKACIEAYYDQWPDMLGGPIVGSVSIFKKLTETCDLKHYALTNWSAELFPIALERFEFLHWFDGRVVSGEEKMRKPESRFYQLLLNRYELEPGEAVFIDDNLRNITAAESMGIKSIQFKDPEQLQHDLKALSLLS